MKCRVQSETGLSKSQWYYTTINIIRDWPLSQFQDLNKVEIGPLLRHLALNKVEIGPFTQHIGLPVTE